jgi:hypothetical protein
VFCGRFVHGARRGRGGFVFGDGSALRGTFDHEGLLTGLARHCAGPANGTLLAEMRGGALHGSAVECDIRGRVSAEGNYADNRRVGRWRFYHPV